jgi:hypothetical protein
LREGYRDRRKWSSGMQTESFVLFPVFPILLCFLFPSLLGSSLSTYSDARRGPGSPSACSG